MTTDSSGNEVANVKYFPFGEARTDLSSIHTDKLFTGQRLDDTGLYYYNARYYDAEIGRFISADTIVPHWTDPQSLNRYSYCRNNPMIYIDPSGHAWYNSWDDFTDSVSGGAEAIGSGIKTGWDTYWDFAEVQGEYVNSGEYAKAVGALVVDNADVAADVVGCVPVVGEPFDLAHGIYDFSQGNYIYGLIGIASAGGQDWLKAFKYTDEVAAASKKLDWDSVVPTGGKNPGQKRVDHIRTHNEDIPTKKFHGVFINDGVDTTNEAWARAQHLGIEPDDAGFLTVPMGRQVGWEGGIAGSHGYVPCNSVTIQVVPDTNQIISAYPTP